MNVTSHGVDLAERVVRGFAEWMGAMAWQVTLLVLIVLVLTWCLRRKTSARFRYALWLIVPIRLVLPPTLALATSWSFWCLPPQTNTPLLSDGPAVAQAPSDTESPALQPWNAQLSTTIGRREQGEFAMGDSRLSHGQGRASTESNKLNTRANVNSREPGERSSLEAGAAKAFTATEDWPAAITDERPVAGNTPEGAGVPLLTAVFAVWLAGVAFLLTRILRGVRQVRALIRESQPASPAVQAIMGRCQSELKVRRPVAIRQSAGVASPMLVGVLRPIVILPTAIEAHLTADELRSVVVHELQHVLRADPVVHALTSVQVIFYWFHPAVWLGQWMLRRLREFACDEATVSTLAGARKSYAQGLVKVAEMLSRNKPLPALGLINRSSEMEARVMQILDVRMKSGRGLSLSALAIIALLGLVLLPGAQRPAASDNLIVAPAESTAPESLRSDDSSRDALPESEDAPPAEIAAPVIGDLSPETQTGNAKLPTILVTVVDEQGQPVAGANIHASYWTDDEEYKKRSNVDLPTNEQGEATVEVYPQLRIFRLWAKKEGYVPLFFNWEQGETDSIPATYKVVLQRGTVIGGVVVDPDGNPVAGAKLDISLEEGGTKVDPQQRVQFNTWLANGVDMAVTDEQGRWSINNVPPGGDVKLRFWTEHPEFITDRGRSSAEQLGMSLEQLREQTARIQLTRGTVIRGRITDPQGQPLAKTLVVWGDDPFFQQGSQEVLTDDDGNYVVPAQAEGELRLTVVAQGWMPIDRMVTVSGNEMVEDFSLVAGKSIRLKIVDPDGKPIPDGYITIRGWHGSDALYNVRHSNVKNSQIPNRTDQDGNFVWDWAPDDSIKLQVYRSDQQISKTLELVPSDDVQTVELRAPYRITGKVIDAETGEPIDQYTVVPITFSTENQSERGIGQTGMQASFDASEFNLANVIHADDGGFMAFRFQAAGYRDFMTQRLSSESPETNLTIRLERAQATTLKARNADGSPAEGARVWIVQADQPLLISRFADYFSDQTRGSLTLDATGQVEFGAPAKRYAVIVASRDGYAEEYLGVDDDPGQVTLRPWASLEGSLVQDGKPVAGASVYVSPIRQLGGDNPHVQDRFFATTDLNGRFSFSQLPPVPVTVQSILTPWEDYPITSNQKVPLDLRPGESRHMSLGGEGLSVTGKVRLIGDLAEQIQFRYGINTLLRLDGGIKTPGHAVDRVEFEAGSAREWNQRLVAGLESNATREQFFVKLRDDGTFLVSGVQPGKYRFLIKIYEPPTGCLVEPVGYGFLEFSTDDYRIAGNRLDLGVVDVQLKAIPTVGDLLPDFRYQDLQQQSHQISELRGKYVLIDFWASWCQPCLAAFPDLEKLHRSLQNNPDVTLISISVDEDFQAAKTQAIRSKVGWDVGVAGKSAETGTSASVLGVSAVPTYVLLDPKGEILYRGFSHDEAAQVLRKSLSTQ